MKNIKIATTNSGVKYKNRDDFLLLTFEKTANVAGVFTTSSIKAAPVIWCQKNIKNGKAKALIVNSGNANAFTGLDGENTVIETAKALKNELGINEEEIFISSTGVIGEILDSGKMSNAVKNSAKILTTANDESFLKAAKAIMTTDLSPKLVKKTCEINGEKIEIIGFAKGSGMIAPNMATMLGYIFTNANISSSILQKILLEANEKTFNAITVDSDTSTNDTVLLFSTNEASYKITDFNDEKLLEFKKTIYDVFLDLAKKIVIDGEGATKLIEIEVLEAKNQEDAKKVAFGIANSPLVKTAIAGEDPNWGRIAMAVGKSTSNTSSEKLQIKIGDYLLTKNGKKHPDYSEEKVHEYLKNSAVKILVKLGFGNSSFKVWTCDLTEKYIKINKDYRS